MQGPPWSRFLERARILTDDPGAVNCSRAPRRVALITVIVALLAAIPGATSAEETARLGDLRVLVVLAGFPDRPLAKQRRHFTGSRRSLVDRLVAYYAEVSSGRLRIVPTVGEVVVTLPRARRTYVQQPDAMARDALLAFAAAVTAPADREALASADALVVFFAGPGRESHTSGGDPNDPWSNYTAIAPPVQAPGGRAFDDACVIAESEVKPFSSFGVLCHEFGHLLGLPELYAPGGRPQEGIGVWGLMGQGTWLRRGERPPHLCAWSKLRLGWVDAETVERTTRGVELPAVERVPRAVKVPAAPGRPQEYYLLENRARIGADRSLPGEGLLVWHVDESVTGFRSAEIDPSHKLLHLVEADGRGDLDRGHAAGGNRGDASDPWSGPPPWRRHAGALLGLVGALLVAAAVLRAVRPRPVLPALGLLAAAAACLAGGVVLRRGPACGPGTPGMAPYDGSPAPVVIRNISPAGPVMRFDVLVAPPRGAD
jgi:M6 family metalloprotease-like protein